MVDMDRNVRILFSIIILISLSARLFVAITPIEVLITKTIQDDAFFGLSVAKNIAAGKGITYNGVDKTNGFQPLWIFIVTPFYLFFNSTDALHAILIFSSFLEVLTIILIFKISQRFLSDKLSLLVSALYGLNPFIIFQTIGGIDIVLSVLLTLLAVYYYGLKNRKEIILGLILGFVVLTRMDNIFLAVALLLHILWTERKNCFIAIKKCLFVIVPAAIVISPWFIWSYLTFGTIIQSSSIGSILSYRSSFEGTPFLSILKMNVMKAVGTILHLMGVTGETIGIPSIVLTIFILASFIFSLKSLKSLIPILLFILLFSSFYVFYFWRIHVRYFVSVFPFVCLICVIGVRNLLTKYSKIKTVGPFAVFAILIAWIIFSGLNQWNKGYYNWQYEMYQGAKWIRENTQKADIIGSFYSGTNLYFSDRRVINLDGLLNYEAIDALKQKKIYSYMKGKGVNYWVDLEFTSETVQKFNFTGNWWADALDVDRTKLNVIQEHSNSYSHFTGKTLYTVFFVVKI